MRSKSLLTVLLLSGLVVLCACVLVGATVGRPYLSVLFSFASSAVAGPQVVQSVFSPDANYEAYVLEQPSVDPPDQRLFIQRRQGTHFVMVAQLSEDVDSVQEIQWAPGSELVVFITSNNLITARIPGFEVLKIPLDTEFARYAEGKFSSYGGGIPRYRVVEVTFPEPGVFAYRLEGLDPFGPAGQTLPMHEIRLSELLGPPEP